MPQSPMSQLTPNTSIDSFATATSTIDMQDTATYPGVYRLECLASGLTADLSGTNFHTIIGFETHDGDNQRWEVTSLRAGFAIRSAYNGAYLSFDLQSDNKTIVSSKFPVSWDIRSVDAQNSGAYRIMWPDTEYLLTLNGGEMTPLCLSKQSSKGSLNQMWRLQECDSRIVIPRADKAVTVEDRGEGDLVVDVEKLDVGKGQLVVSTTTTTRIRRILGW